ncbi:hypothetical protein NE237_021398 [Protea cynaroides]|uniref:Uncharacterized protein n=1 Tax=Protea cynaroides TaxID=273540 RepID=A0A9Q0K4U9_9MAGN|nr:hypothetical protein NE237_021398 [Protea cynaroides]
MEKKRVFSVIPVLVLVLVLVVLLRCEGADHGSSYYSSPACNSTIAACIAEDVEFLMESQVTRRILDGAPNYIIYKTLNTGAPPGGGSQHTTATGVGVNSIRAETLELELPWILPVRNSEPDLEYDTLQCQNPNPGDRHHQTPANINLFSTGDSTSASGCVLFVASEGGGVQVSQRMGEGKAAPISEASGENMAAAQFLVGLVLADGCIHEISPSNSSSDSSLHKFSLPIPC